MSGRDAFGFALGINSRNSNLKDVETLSKCCSVTTNNRDHARECGLKLDQQKKEEEKEKEKEEEKEEKQLKKVEPMNWSGRDPFGFALGINSRNSLR